MRKKTISMLLALTMAATTLAGCITVNAEETFEGTLRWLNYKPEVADAMNEIAAAYTEETGIDMKIETAASGQYEATLTARMDSSEAPAIFVVDSTNMLNTWKDYIADLSGTELYTYCMDDSYTLNDGNGYIYGISYALEHWGIIANKAILEAYFASENKSTEYTSVDDLYTFEALKAVVEDMTALKDELGIQGVFGSTSLKAGDDWRYQTHLMNLPLYYEWGEETDINGAIPEFTFEYAEGMKNIMDLYLNNSVVEPTLVGTKSVDDSMAEFALGQCAMIQNGCWSWNTIANTEGKAVEDEDVIFLPITIGAEGEENMGLSVTGSQYVCINSTQDEATQKAAADFLAWLFSSETGKQMVAEKLQFVTPFTTMADATYTNPLFASANAVAAAGKKEYKPVCNLIPNQTWKDAFGANMLMYAQGQMEWDDVVKAAVDSWAVEREYTNMANGY